MTDDPGQPPGNHNLMRILAETLDAHDQTLAAGDGLVARLAPQHWAGPAREAFVNSALPRLDAEWQQIKAINHAVAARVARHSVFLHNLRELWSSYSNDPAARAHVRAVWEQETEKLAGELAGWARKLDELGHLEFADEPVAGDPPPEPPPRLAPPGPPPPPVPPTRPPPPASPPPDDEPDWEQAVLEPYRVALRLRQQLLTGERRDEWPWTA